MTHITQSALIEYLNKKFTHSFDFRYIRRLTDKVMGQAKSEIDRALIEPRLTALREMHRVAREALMRVLERAMNETGKSRPWDSSVIMAARSLIELDIAVLTQKSQTACTRTLDEAAANLRYPALPEEQRGTIASTFKKWNIYHPALLSRASLFMPPKLLPPPHKEYIDEVTLLLGIADPSYARK